MIFDLIVMICVHLSVFLFPFFIRKMTECSLHFCIIFQHVYKILSIRDSKYSEKNAQKIGFVARK